MNTELVRKLTVQLDEAEKLLIELKKEADSLHLNHQNPISVNVPGTNRWIGVAENGGREHGWMSKMIRGREMIMLGIKKAYMAMIEEQEEKVSTIKALIAQEAA